LILQGNEETYTLDKEHPPLKPPNKYMLFCQAERKPGAAKHELPNRWKQLSNADIAVWEAKAARALGEYQKNKKKYFDAFGEDVYKEMSKKKKV